MKDLIKQILTESYNEEDYIANINGLKCKVDWVTSSGFDLIFQPLITFEEYKGVITTLKGGGGIESFSITSARREGRHSNTVTHVGALSIQFDLKKLIASYLSVTTDTNQFDQFG